MHTEHDKEAIHHAIQLRTEGLSYAKIVAATGLGERAVKETTRHIKKPTKPKKSTTIKEIKSPLTRSANRIFELARRQYGIRDYELRGILHEEYGSSWDTSTGRYNSNYNSDTITRVKSKVRKKAAELECRVIFVMDWISEKAPRASSDFLTATAYSIIGRIEEFVTDYMAMYATGLPDDALAHKKQGYAAKRHLLKLAVKQYGGEPVEVLMGRTADLVSELEGNRDADPAGVTGITNATGLSTAKDEKPEYYPEPSRADHFLDYAESEGWIPCRRTMAA